MKNETIEVVTKEVTVMVAITGIVVLDAVALMNGINGTLFTLAMIAIAGLAGYEIQDVLKYFKGDKV